MWTVIIVLLYLIVHSGFSKVDVDILEFGDKNSFAMIDSLPHWLELIYIKAKTSVIDCFEDIFTRFGYPQVRVADNLPFLSSHWKKYLKSSKLFISLSPKQWVGGEGSYNR